MSQIFVPMTDSNIPVDVPTSFVTDSGTAIPAAHILNVNANFTSADNTRGIRTSANPNASNNLLIELTDRFYTQTPCPANSTTTLVTFALASSAASYRFEFEVIGRDVFDNSTVGYTLFSTFKTDGATATIIATPFIDADEDASRIACSIQMIASGNNVLLQLVTGAGNIMNVGCKGSYITV